MNQAYQQQRHNESVVTRSKDVFLTTSATNLTYTMTPYDHYVEVVTVSTYTMTLTLPPIKEARGMIYTIWLKTDSGVDLTVEDNNGDAGFSDVTYADANDMSVLYSDGHSWRVLYSTGV